ncbi:ribose ABC transporter substrate-binding protein RbsB [Rossellomorea marisflavi]|uniref:Ribose ABC transporter substrate-binding protein RbsB n=1 Tax=Rossellomorea marisflavi TaxID=189381 RepID=A0A5D4RI55_9BACI|nr:ribose ABC transporter substrate-binding protein RbsB [Rossellomorea marisflavi]MBV6682070.1 ribose ABC transporter substrate-binding protein RbsB [Bacillus sp. JRC01]VXB10194.1 ribose ABC transporter (ribose-binding lipoprotein) [Bacillus sp. 349Y]MDW4525033.1 ribose ABC transporter substrate-binding protein RbsB [Rossellomorea marisflavi]TYS50560.1 ribose ABC transporter substrate-binding protein RbsB [Rossellomorea marisflavi]UTE72537.1 ribose ABC transporter substrate-binding protein Rb
MKKLIVLMMSISLVFLAACSLQPPEWAKPSGKKDPKDLKIGLSVSTLNNPFFVSIKEGVQKEAKAQGMKVIVVDAQNDAAKQINDVEDLIQQGVDLLLINPTDSSAISTAVQSANSIGIPVVTLDRSADKGDVATLVSSDNEKGGEMAADYLIKELGEGTKVAELEGVPGASATRERGKGFHNLADDKLDVAAKQTANFDRTQGLNTMENILQGNPDIKAVFAHNDEMALGAQQAIQSSGRDVLVVGFDGNEDALKSIEEGNLSATVAQQPEEIGKLAVQAGADVLNGKKVDKMIPVPLKLVTKDKE